MATIELLKNRKTKGHIYPITLTEAVHDKNGDKLSDHYEKMVASYKVNEYTLDSLNGLWSYLKDLYTQVGDVSELSLAIKSDEATDIFEEAGNFLVDLCIWTGKFTGIVINHDTGRSWALRGDMNVENSINLCTLASGSSGGSVDGLVTIDGTVISKNLGFAEIAQWVDENPNDEDRLGYFVTTTKTDTGVVMEKATSTSDVTGVTISHPAFAGNATKNKFSEGGYLLPEYDYVGIRGFCTVIDNGLTTVNEKCVPGDDGTAVASIDGSGYTVVARADSTHVIIMMDPSTLSISKMEVTVNDLKENGVIADIEETELPEEEMGVDADTLGGTYTKEDIDTLVSDVNTISGNVGNMSQISGMGDGTIASAIAEANNIAKGASNSRSFETFAEMEAWLRNASNKGLRKAGDNLYIKALDVPDYWIASVLDSADPDTGYYYTISQLETQKVDLTEYDTAISNLSDNKLDKTGNSANNVTIFTSGDDATASAWTNVAKLSSGETHSSIFGKISTMFKNIRYLYNMLGTTDISSIGNGTVTDAIEILNGSLNHNIPRLIPKDITSYYQDGSLWKRLHGTDGYSKYEDIFVGDYFKMSRAISAYNQDQTYQLTGSDYVTIAGISTLMGNGDNNNSAGKIIDYEHLVMIPGKGMTGTFHFGRSRMNATNTTEGGYYNSEMNQTTLGAVVTSGSTDATATINQQLYAEFGTHLKTTRELLSNAINATGYNRFGNNGGCTSGWSWYDAQAVLMSEVEVYGSIVWSSSGYDTGSANKQLPVFMDKRFINNRSSWYWLKDVASAVHFCHSNCDGVACFVDAARAGFYVRPRFVIS